jgi:hypothetical protein
MIFEDIVVDQGRVDVSDLRQSPPAAVTLAPLSLKVKGLSTLPGKAGEKTFSATSGDGETLTWTGTVSLNPVVTRGRLSIENLKASTVWEFVRDKLNLEQPAGKLSISADYSVDLSGEEPNVACADMDVALSGIALKLQGAEAPFLELPDMRASAGRFDLSGRQADIGKIAVKGGRADLSVDEDGGFDLQQIAKAAGAPKPPAPDAAGPSSPAPPWKIKLDKFELGGFAADFRNLSRKPGIRASVGEIKVGLKAEAEAGDQLQVKVDDIAVGVSALQGGPSDAAGPTLQVDSIALKGGSYDLAANQFAAEAVAISGGAVDVRREADGTVNLAHLIAPPEKGVIREQIEESADEAAAAGRPFQLLIKTVSLSGLQAAVSDLAVRPGGPLLHLYDVSAAASDVDGKSPMTFELGVGVREGGRIKAAGTVDPSVPSVESEVQVAGLDLTPLQPYIGQAAAVALMSGTFSTKGSLRHGIKAAGAQTAYQGGFKVEALRVTEAGGDETLVGWKAVQSEQLKLTIEPNGLEIGDVRVLQPAGKVVIEKDGALNLAKVATPGAETKQDKKPDPSGTAAAFPYRVRRVLIDAGRVDFADLSLPIPFGAKIHELKGTVAGISSANTARAQVKLDGRVDEYGTAKIDGELNTSDPKAFTDIAVVFRNVEMSRLTPYSGKFAGRKIDSGKLSVDLKYKIDQSRLAGENQIVVERLSLGQKVESPDAVDLPLDLAVALLEDSNGVIDLGLPVQGNLNAPEFSFGALIGKAIVNLLTKIVTSPFRALGALIPGGGEETLKNVAFAPGSASVPPPEKEKLAKLAEALQKRPQLKLTVQGRYNPETDRAELRTAALRSALAARLGQITAPGEDPGPVDYSSPETGKALEAVFSERFGADALKNLKAELKATTDKARKEAAAKGQAAAPGAEAEDPGRLAKLLFGRLAEAEPVDEAALVRLADDRAQAVIDELGRSQALPAERLGAEPSKALGKNDPVTAALELEVMK